LVKDIFRATRALGIRCAAIELKPSYHLLTAVVCNAALFLLFFAVFSPGFETNDDAIAMRIISGSFSGTPDEHLFIMSAFAGIILKQLYLLFPSICWYALALMCMHLLAGVAILFVLLRTKPFLFATALYGLFFFLCICPVMLKLQWTSTAASIAGAGVLLLLFSLEEADRAMWLPPFFTALAFLVLSAIIRWRGCAAVMVLFLPVFIFEMLKGRILKPALCLAVVAASILVIIGFDQVRYRGVFADNFYRYSASLGALCNDPLDHSTEKLASVGWTMADLGMMEAFFWIDPVFFTEKNICAAAQAMRAHRSPRGVLCVLRGSFLYEQNFLMVLAVTTFLATLLAGDRRRRFMPALVAATFCAIVVALTWTSRLPHRIFFPLLSATVLYAVYLFSFPADGRKNLRNLGILFGMLALPLFRQIHYLSTEDAGNRRAASQYEAVMDGLEQFRGKTIVVQGGVIPYEGMRPFIRIQPSRGFNLVPTGWATFTPAYKDLCSQIGVEDLFRALLSRDDVLYVGFTGFLNRYMTTRYGRHIQSRQVGTASGVPVLRLAYRTTVNDSM